MSTKRSRAPRAFWMVAIMAMLLSTVGAVAQAAVSEPEADDVVGGVVEISEDTGPSGGNANCGISNQTGQLYSRIEVHRLDGGVSVEEVFSETRTAGVDGVPKGPWTAEWDTAGLPNGPYRILSFNRVATGTCTLQPEAMASDFTVILENAVVAVPDLPESHVTGEPLEFSVTTENDIDGAAMADREVTIEVADLDPQTVTTDEDGTATVSFDLPDLPAGPIEVTTSTVGDPGFVEGRTLVSELELDARSTELTWTGDTRSSTSAPARLEARLVDATAGSDRTGDPVSNAEVTLTVGDLDYLATTDGDGRATRVVNLGAPERQVPASAAFGGNDTHAEASSDSFTFLVTDQSAAPEQRNGLLGGISRLVTGVVKQPSTVAETVTDVVDNTLPTLNLGTELNNLLVGAGLSPLPLQEVDDILESTLGDVLDDVTELVDAVDPVVDELLDTLGEIEGIGDLVNTLRYSFDSVYVRPDGSSLTRNVDALIGIPTPIDVTGDRVPDVTANLTLAPDVDGPGIGGLPVMPLLDVIKLPGAPAHLPMSVQAVIGGNGGLLDFGTGSLRIGWDARTTSAPERATLQLGIADGGFDLDLTTSGAQDLAIVGTFEGDGLDLGLGGGSGNIDETRFSLSLSPAPASTRIGLGIGDGAGGLGASFTTSSPTKVGLTFTQDSGGSQLTAVDAAFEDVFGTMALVLDAGSGGDGPVPELGLQLLSDNGLDRIFVQARSFDQGQITDDMLLSLIDVPASVAFGVSDTGGIGLTASQPIGLMEAGFASGGAIDTLDEPAYLYMTNDGAGYESVGIRLPGVSSLTADLTDNIGLELNIAPTKLRAVLDTPESSLDAAIYDAPAQFSLGLAADGAFLIEGSAPIDLIMLTVADSSGAFLGAESITARIESIPRLLSIALVGEAMSFDTGGQAVGLLELVVGDAAPFVPGEDALIASFGDDIALAVRLHGLRTITANLDLSAPEFFLDTVAQRILNLNLAVALEGFPELAVTGRIDHLQPNLTISVLTDDDGNLTGVQFTSDGPSNIMALDVPGLASFSVFDPLPADFILALDMDNFELNISGSEYFTLQLAAEAEFALGDGDPLEVAVNVNSMRAKQFGFGLADIENFEFSEDDLDADTMGAIGMALNTRHADGELATMGDPTRTLAAFNAGNPTPTTQGSFVIVIPGVALDEGLGSLLGNVPLTLTPRGLAGDQAQVLMELVDGAGETICAGINLFGLCIGEWVDLPGVFHRETLGGMHCTGTNASNGTNLAINASALGIVNITIPMRDALCGGTSERADMVLDVDGPADVLAGDDIVHTATARNNGPNPATDVTITAAHQGDLGLPGATCAGASVSFGTDTITCTWAGSTARNVERAMTLIFPGDPSTPSGSSATVDYTASSATVGDSASASVTSTVHDAVANLSIVDIDAPEAAVAGHGDVVHTVTVRNDGPSAATDLVLSATDNGELDAPSVSCSDGGSASGLGCEWASVAAGDERSIELTFGVPAGTPNGTLEVDYTASSATPGAGDSATLSTAIASALADLVVVGVAGPDRVSPGEQVVQSVTFANDGPSAAQTARVFGDYSDELGHPMVLCSDGGAATVQSELQRARCLWFGETESGAERTITLAWDVPDDHPLGSTFDVDYRATSDTQGSDAQTSVSTQIDHESDLQFSQVNAPELWSPPTSGTAAANNLVHSVVATNDGGAANDVTIVGALPADGVINNPSVSCPNGGTGSILDDPDVADDTRAQCVWADVPAGADRTMTLTWNVAAINGARNAAAPDDPVIDVDYELSAAGVGVADTATTSTELLAAVSNLRIHTSSAPASVLTNQQIQHQVQIRLNPATAPNLTIVGTYDEALGAPTGATCASSTGGVNTSVPGEVRCTWASTAAGTTSAATRTMALTWNAAAVGTAGPGTYETSFVATSDNPGSPADATLTTEVVQAQPEVAITGVIAPSQVVAGGQQLVHHLDARNVGNVATTNMLLAAEFGDALGTPSVTCTGTGASTPAATDTTASCLWPGSSTVNAPRRMTLTWDVAPDQAPGTHAVDYSASADGAGDPVTASASSAVVTRADLDVVVTAPETAGPGDLVHEVDVTAGPSTAADVTLEFVDNGALGSAAVACSDDGDVTANGCEWTASPTAPGTVRTATVTWSVPPSGSGTLNADYSAFSSSAGADASASATTAFAPVADLDVVSLTAPDTVDEAQASVEHTIVGTNNGPSDATAFQLSAVHNGALGSPTVSCSAGGTVFAGPDANQVRCVWFGDTGVGANRTMTLNWANGEAGEILEVDYAVTSSTAGNQATASATTEII